MHESVAEAVKERLRFLEDGEVDLPAPLLGFSGRIRPT
jgi:hypothetical protein